MKFSPNIQGRAQGATYASIKEHIVGKVQTTFKGGHDIAKSLKDMKVIDLKAEEPKRALSDETDEKKRTIAQDGIDIKYQEELRRHLDRKDNLDQGLKKAYSLIYYGYCTKTMQTRIEEHPPFATKIEDNPIALLEAIQTLTHDPIRAQNPMISKLTAMRNFLNIKQQPEESLLDYFKRLKQAKDVFKSHVGSRIFRENVEKTEKYQQQTDAKQRAQMIEDDFEETCALVFLQGSDQSKYGSLMRGFISQYSLANDQYPKTLQAAVDVLSNHKFDSKYHSLRGRVCSWLHSGWVCPRLPQT